MRHSFLVRVSEFQINQTNLKPVSADFFQFTCSKIGFQPNLGIVQSDQKQPIVRIIKSKEWTGSSYNWFEFRK